MKLSLILENTDIRKVLSKLDPKRIQFMCGDKMPSMDPKSSGFESQDMGKAAELVKIISDCDPTPTKKWVVGTEFLKKPWISAQFNDGKIAIDGFRNMPSDNPQIKLPEDTASMVELIQFFSNPGRKDQLKKNFPEVPTDLLKHDIRSALTASQNLMDKLRNKKATAFNPVVTSGAVKMLDQNGYEVYMYPRLDLAKNFGLEPETVITSLAEAGMGSKWCTRTDYPNGSRAESYLKNDSIYTMFKDKVATYQTVVKGKDEQFMDRSGTEVGNKVDPSINKMFLTAMMAAKTMLSYSPPEGATQDETIGYIKNYQEVQAENIAGIVRFGGVEQVTNNPQLRSQIVDSLQLARNPKFISIAVKPLIDNARNEVKYKLNDAGADFDTSSLKQTLQILGLSELYLASPSSASGYGLASDSELEISDSTKEIVSLFVRKPTIYGSVIYHAAGHLVIGKTATKELFLGLRKPVSDRKTFPAPMVQFLSSGAGAEDIMGDPRVVTCLCGDIRSLVTLIRFNKFTAKMVELVPQEIWQALSTTVDQNDPRKKGQLLYADVIKKLQDLKIDVPTFGAQEDSYV
jgi:hypothetical protein